MLRVLLSAVVVCLSCFVFGCSSESEPSPDDGLEAGTGPDGMPDWSGTTVPFTVTSTPSGAAVRLSSGERCKTPCTVKRPLTENFDVTVEKSGFRSKSESIVSHTNVLPGTGAGGRPQFSKPKLSPNPLVVVLEPVWDR